MTRPRTNLIANVLTFAGLTALLLTGCGRADSNAPAPTNSAAPANPAGAGSNTAGQAGTNSQNQPTGNATGAAQKRYSHAPDLKIDPNKGYTATVTTTEGTFQIQLFAKDAPVTVNNFIFLSKDHFYDNVKFHRIIKDFMIQTGDPTGTGAGGPGYTIPDELPPRVPYSAGIVAMANTGAPNTGGSQFFICTVDDSKKLAPEYTIFGKVVSGMDVIDKIANTPVGQGSGIDSVPSVPLKDVRIQSITIQETAGG